MVNFEPCSWGHLNVQIPLRWRHHEHDSVSNHQPHHCLLNRLLRADQRKHQSSASLAFVRGIHQGPVNSPHKWPVTRKMFPFDDVIMTILHYRNLHSHDCLIVIMGIPIPGRPSFYWFQCAWGSPCLLNSIFIGCLFAVITMNSLFWTENSALVGIPLTSAVGESIGGCLQYIFNTLRPRQNGRLFADSIFTCIFLNENV